MNAVLYAFPDERVAAERLAKALRTPLSLVETHHFPDGELLPSVAPPSPTIIVYRSLDRPNIKLIELLLAANAWRRNGARRIVLAAPYLCYMRQDAAFRAGEPVSQEVIGGLLGRTFDRIVTVDAHLHRTTSMSAIFPNTACTNLSAATAIADHLRAEGTPPDLVVLGPDGESRPWAQAIASSLRATCYVMTKERLGDARVILHPPPSFSISRRPVLIVDDIASSGATLIDTANLLVSAGAGSIAIAVTHALFSDAVTARLHAIGVSRIISCDSCRHSTNTIPLAPVLAEVLRQELPT